MKPEKNELKIFGNNVKEYRIINKLTQEQLAEKISVSSVQIGRIETGRNACTIQTMLNLCKALNVTPNDLFKNITDLPTYTDNAVFLNNFFNTHLINTEETKEFEKYIFNFFSQKND